MLFVFLLLLIVTANIVGCIRCKNSSIRFFLGIAAGVWALLTVLIGLFVYETAYKINEIDVSVSPGGEFELYFQQIGDPEWPFGYTHVQLVLKDGEKTIVKRRFNIADDGCNAGSRNWQVSWNETYVSAVISGSEQSDWEYDIYFDGTIEDHQLETVYGIVYGKESAETQTVKFHKK